ncbi:flagellar motor protein MotB [bacterium]|nr:flagellar motor protein MotB [bacterium]
MARKRSKAGGHEEENVERWLLTYSDMITLLMAFFIMMYAMSVLNLGKFSQLAVSVRSGFGGEAQEMMSGTLGISSDAGVLGTVLPADSFSLMAKIAGSVRDALPPEDVGNVEFLSEDGVVTIRVRADDVLFARGSADLTPQALRTLGAIAKVVAPLPNQLRIEGHTCDLPVHNARFANNWELSAQRAVNVLLYLVQQHGFSPGRISAAGYAETVPVVPNDSEQNRARNRRIDIVLLQPQGKPVATKSGVGSEQTGTPNIAPPAVELTLPALENMTEPKASIDGASPDRSTR